MKIEMTINEIQKFTYLFQALKGVENKTKDLSKFFVDKNSWRVKAAMTNFDKAIANVLKSMHPDVFRQMKYINDTHETLMIPTKEKLKHLKNLESIDHLFTLRDAVVRNKCNECVEKDKNVCRVHKMLQSAGTPYFWDMDNLDVLPEEDKKMAEHCGYCGGFFNGQTAKELRTNQTKRKKTYGVYNRESYRRSTRATRKLIRIKK